MKSTLITRSRAVLAATLLSLASGAVVVQPAVAETVANNHTVPVLPYRGMYYEIGHGGTGLVLDVDKNGAMFVTFYTYDKDGNQAYYLMQGDFKASSENERMATGIIGTMTSDVYTTKNGECVGSGCTYQRPDIIGAPFKAHLTWTTPRNLHLQLGDQTWDVQGGQYTISDADNLIGTWALNGWYNDSGQATYSANVCTIKKASVRFQPSDFPVTRDKDGNVTAGVAIPDDADLFRVRCDWNRSVSYFIWYQGSTGKAQLFNAKLAFGDAPPTDANKVFAIATLYPDGPTVIRARTDFGGVEGQPSNGGSTFVRMPSGVSTWSHWDQP